MRWAVWWTKTSNTWQYNELLIWFIETCYDNKIANYAAILLQAYLTKSHTRSYVVGVTD